MDSFSMMQVDQAEAEKYYNVGPPYSMHRSDWVRFLDAWTGCVGRAISDPQMGRAFDMSSWLRFLFTRSPWTT